MLRKRSYIIEKIDEPDEIEEEGTSSSNIPSIMKPTAIITRMANIGVRKKRKRSMNRCSKHFRQSLQTRI